MHENSASGKRTFTRDVETKDYSQHAICPSGIFKKEQEEWNSPETASLKRCPNIIGFDLETIIQNLVLRYNQVMMSQWQALLIKPDRELIPLSKTNPFQSNFFFADSLANVLNLSSTNKPRKNKQYYCYSYHEYFTVKQEEVFPDQFELLFAFALRQCSLLHVTSFLYFHSEKNFQSQIVDYITFIKQIKSKFGSILFTDELIKSINNWISENSKVIRQDDSSRQSETDNKQKSFVLSNPKDEKKLSNLLDGLKKYQFVSKETSLPIFKKIFRGEKIINPIVWTGNISELHYFIKHIHRATGKIKPLHQKIWKTTAYCLADSDGKRFDWKAFNGQKKPAKASLLERIAENL